MRVIPPHEWNEIFIFSTKLFANQMMKALQLGLELQTFALPLLLLLQLFIDFDKEPVGNWNFTIACKNGKELSSYLDFSHEDETDTLKDVRKSLHQPRISKRNN